MHFRSPLSWDSGTLDLGNRSAPTADQATEIENCLPPQDIKQLQRFLGMVNFYRRFLPNCAQVLKSLTDLLRGGAKTLQWTATAQEAFQMLSRHWCLRYKYRRSHAAKIRRPLAAPRFLFPQTDRHRITFFNFWLQNIGRSGSNQTFLSFCEGRVYQLWTDHKPLVTALSRVSITVSPRQQRHPAFISEFNVQLLYLPVLKNVVADFLCRPSTDHWISCCHTNGF